MIEVNKKSYERKATMKKEIKGFLNVIVCERLGKFKAIQTCNCRIIDLKMYSLE